MLERRQNPVGRAMTGKIPRISLGGLRVAVLGMEATADFMIEAAIRHKGSGHPLYLTSANGEVLARCSTDGDLDQLFRSADLISADGQPLVMASRWRAPLPLPERVATTDLFHIVARKAAARKLTFYMYGASEEENIAAVANAKAAHPDLDIVGHSHGFLSGRELDGKIDEINALAPDFLWVALGVPREQLFVKTFASRLTNVGVIKTSGGLFNFLSGSRARAPKWMQAAGFEWAWRIALEPRRLAWRYATTNPRAMLLLLSRSGPRSSSRR
jgi:N-acetylglucosaminyldiphosphoundecaprenol N-acetyl-beta-D-mannosaminyltransferase